MAYNQTDNPFKKTSCGRRYGPLNGTNNDTSLNNSPLNCWKGYSRVPGTKEFSDNSCEKSSPTKLTDKQYNKKNVIMRSKNPGMNNQQTSGTGSARVKFAARFGGQGHSMTDKDGSPSGYAHALKRWGFSSAGEAKAFANKNKKS